ncbi:MAG: RimK family alpha-L-glutamate ligase [Nanoarchaeota archaeon]
MRVWILAKRESFENYASRRFLEEAMKQDVTLELVAPEDVDIIATKEGKKSILLRSEVMPLPDCLIPRMGSGTTYFALAIIRHLEKLGVLVLNTALAIDLAKDKLATVQMLAASNIPIPKTMLAKFPLNLELVEKEFSYPIVLKTVSGSQGKGVFLCEKRSKLKDIMDLMETSMDAKVNVILQEFVAGSKGKDIRVIVIGGRPIGAMLRQAKKGSFKANVSNGAKASPFPLNPSIEWLSTESARIIGLEIAGVDLLMSDGQYFVSEVNSSPGFEGFEPATGLNIPKAIFDFIRVRVGQ